MKKICRSFDTYRLPQDALEILENGIYDRGGYKKRQKKISPACPKHVYYY